MREVAGMLYREEQHRREKRIQQSMVAAVRELFGRR